MATKRRNTGRASVQTRKTAKGEARYWTIRVAGRVEANAV